MTPISFFQYGLSFAGCVACTGLVVLVLLFIFFGVVSPLAGEPGSDGNSDGDSVGGDGRGDGIMSLKPVKPVKPVGLRDGGAKR